jgi:spore coat protein CotF
MMNETDKLIVNKGVIINEPILDKLPNVDVDYAQRFVKAQLESRFNDMLNPLNRGKNFTWEQVGACFHQSSILAYFAMTTEGSEMSPENRSVLKDHLSNYCQTFLPDMIRHYSEKGNK